MIRPAVNRLFWSGYARVYDRNQSLPYLHSLALYARKVVAAPGGKYLDLGCGTGNSTGQILNLLDRQGTVIGVDRFAAFLSIARGKYASEERVDLRQIDVRDPLPFATGEFDGVLASHSLYVFERPAEVIGEVMRVLKPGGRFLMSNPAAGASAANIFRAHLAEKRSDYQARLGKVLGGLALGVHSLRAGGNFALLFPFQLAIEHSVKMTAHFWPLERWQEVLAEARREGGRDFVVEEPFRAYAGQYQALLCRRI